MYILHLLYMYVLPVNVMNNEKIPKIFADVL